MFKNHIQSRRAVEENGKEQIMHYPQNNLWEVDFFNVQPLNLYHLFFYTSGLTRTPGYLSCCLLTLWRTIYNNGDRIWPHLKYWIKALISCFTARASLVLLVARIITNHPSFYTYYFRQENQIGCYFLINLYILHVHLTPFLNMFFMKLWIVC